MKTAMKSSVIRLFIWVLPLFLFSSGREEDNRIERILDALNVYNSRYTQQKVFLHLDKPSYKAGDIIWYKAYLVDGMDHLPDTMSTNLYVEMIGPEKTSLVLHRILLKDGIAWGDFEIRDTMPEGLYQIRAYTNWMRNFDPRFYFVENIPVTNSRYSDFISPKDARKNRRTIDSRLKKSAQIDVQFFPEGGNLVAGLTSRLAFKAISSAGKGIDINGIIYNSSDGQVAEFKSTHRGMGSILFTPVRGEKYHAIIVTEGHTLKEDLPQAAEQGLIMRVESTPLYAYVNLYSNTYKTADRFANEVVVIGQTRGKVCYKAIADMSEDSTAFAIDKSLFPGGIAQITVFSARLESLAERLIFVDHHDNISFSLDSITTNKDNLSEFAVSAHTNNGQPVAANLSFALLDASKTNESDFSSNISTYMLLTSDLRGSVEDPGYYFADSSVSRLRTLDNLLLTQGWRRFEWNQLVNHEYPEINYPRENGITIEGKITWELFGIPLSDCEVTLTILSSYNDIFTQYSKKDGSFKFDGLTYYDSVEAKIEALKTNGKKSLVINLPEPETDEITNFSGVNQPATESTRNNREYRRAMFKKEEKERLIAEKEEKEKNRYGSIYGTPDNVIRAEDMPPGTSNIFQVLQGRVPGVDVRGNRVVIRGVKSLYGSTDPLYLLDGIPLIDAQAINSIPVTDVDRIEILKGTSASMYGSRGANGVIAIYTKRGDFLKKGVITFQMLGYSTPRRFYQPKYDADAYTAKPGDMPVTIYWKPVIRTDTTGKATVVVNMPAIIKKSRLVIEGISVEGKPGYLNQVF